MYEDAMSYQIAGCCVWFTGKPSIVIVGSGSTATYIYDITTGLYTTGAARPYFGDHHAAEVINDKLWLFGGLNGPTSATYTAVQVWLDS